MTERLDLVLVARGLARSRSQAAELIRSGRVSIDGTPVRRPSLPVGAQTRLEVQTDPWVSRAAHKLLGALDGSGIAVPGRVLDAGASTGGFSQVLLARGARRVYAVDVGHGQLDPVLRADPRVVVREGLNLRELTLADLEDEAVELAVADVSFISLTLLLEPIFAVLSGQGSALLMVKPQFEVGRAGLDRTGVVRSRLLREQAVESVVDEAARLGWTNPWRQESVLPGPAGNVEYFCLFHRATSSGVSAGADE